MPIWHFHECMKGELTHVARSKHYKYSKLERKWAIVFDEYLKEYGLPESYKRYFDKMKKAMRLYNDVYVKGKRWELVRARIAEEEAKIEIQVEGESILKTCARISKFMGFPVDAKKVPVSQFYSYIEIVNDGR